MELIEYHGGEKRFAPVSVETWRQVMALLELPDNVVGVTFRNARKGDPWENLAAGPRGGWVMIVDEHMNCGAQVLRSYVRVDVSDDYLGLEG